MSRIKNRNSLGQVAYQGGKQEAICQLCKKPFLLYRSDIARNRRFCSVDCASKAGTPRPNRRVMVKPCEYCKKLLKPKLSRIRFCSYSCANHALGKGRRIGEKNGNWKGGISKEWKNFYLQEPWLGIRKEAYKRDGYACVRCGAKSLKLHA